jgi:uncharacterized small protein (DUF1192 family)
MYSRRRASKLDLLSHADLKDLVLKLLEEVAELRRTVAAQRDEIARLKDEPRQKDSKTSKLTIHEERTVTLMTPPQGSRFKGYTDFVVQDLVIHPHVVNFHCERAARSWQRHCQPASRFADFYQRGHFGPELRRFVLAQYHQRKWRCRGCWHYCEGSASSSPSGRSFDCW